MVAFVLLIWPLSTSPGFYYYKAVPLPCLLPLGMVQLYVAYASLHTSRHLVHYLLHFRPLISTLGFPLACDDLYGVVYGAYTFVLIWNILYISMYTYIYYILRICYDSESVYEHRRIVTAS